MASDATGDPPSQGRPEPPANLGFFQSLQNGRLIRENADNVFVLVDHYDFEKINKEHFEQYNREGDDKDVSNLRTTLGSNRNCNFRDLSSPKKEELLEILSDEVKLLQLFSSKDVPSVLMLFFLSHGGEDGIILTDHYCNKNEFVHFTTGDIAASLGRLSGFENCLKLINLGPCRGDLDDARYDAKKEYKDYPNRNSCRVTFSPGIHNTVVFYSTVETTRSNRNETGSWFVQKFCDVFDSVAEDKPLINVLTQVMRQMHYTSRDYRSFVTREPQGQTPEVKMFPHTKQFFVSKCAVSKARPSTSDSRKAKEASVKSVSEFFSWKSDSGRDIRGRRAFLFYAERKKLVVEMEQALSQNLGFETSMREFRDPSILSFLGEVNEFELEDGVGCILTCLLGSVDYDRNTHEVYVSGGGYTYVKIDEILHELVGYKNDKWIGKPKIMFLVNLPFQVDEDDISRYVGQAESAMPTSRRIIHATNHSGWLVLVVKNKESCEKLMKILKGPELKSGRSLQELLATILISKPKDDLLLLNSTLQYLLDFPDLSRPFVRPEFILTVNSSERIRIGFDDLLEEAQKVDKSRVWLLSCSAGAGKSTILEELGNQLRKTVGSNVKVLQPLVSNVTRNISTHVDDIEFLAKVTHYTKTELEYWIKRKKCIVIIDAFDEICPRYRNKVLHLIGTLVEKGVTLWIGTRPHEAKVILRVVKNATHVEIFPWSEERQVEFLKAVLKKSDQECEQFMSNFKNNDILQNPLHLYLLASNVCENESNLFKMFSNLMWQKVETRLVKDNDFENVSQRKVKSELRRHQSIALRFIKNGRLVRESGETDEDDLMRLNDFGILTYENGNVSFLHRTFAEFLVAKHFLDELTESGVSCVPVFEMATLQQCRAFVELFISTLDKEREIQTYTKALLLTAKQTKKFLVYVCGENLLNIFQVVKPYLSLQEDRVQALDSVSLKISSEILLSAIGSTEISCELLDMGVLSSERLFQVLPEILGKIARQNAISFFNKLKEKFPNLKELIRQKGPEINAANLAVEEGRHQILDLLLQNGVDASHIHNGETALFGACRRGHVSCVEVLFKRGFTSTRNEDFLDPLNVAAAFGHLDLVKFLLDENISGFVRNKVTFQIKSNYEDNAFHLAVVRGHKEVCEYLLSKSPDLRNTYTNRGESALQLAAKCSWEMCRWLAKEGNADLTTLASTGLSRNHRYDDYFLMLQSDANMRDEFGKTPLHCAARHANLELVRDLIESGAEINAKDMNGWNAMHFACTNSQFATVKLLHSKNCHLAKEKTDDGCTALHIFLEHCQPDWDDGLENVKFLLKTAGVDVKAVDSRGETALSIVVKRNSRKFFMYIMKTCNYFEPTGSISYGSKHVPRQFSLRKAEGYASIHLAARFYDFEILRNLIEISADINRRDRLGRTALHIAMSGDRCSGHIDPNFVQLLIESGADLDAFDIRRQTALHFAVKTGRLDLVQLLLDHGADVNLKNIDGENVLHAACRWFDSNRSDFDVILALHAKNGALVKETTSDGSTCLHLVLINCYSNKITEELMHDQAKETAFDLNAGNASVETAMVFACQQTKLLHAVSFLSKIVDVNKQTRSGETALHFAVEIGRLDLVQLLLNHGADVNLKNIDGENVLHVACRWFDSNGSDFDVILALHAKNGALVKETTSDGSTCLHLALGSFNLLSPSKLQPNEELIFWLVEETAIDLNASNASGETALMIACQRTKLLEAVLLLSKYVDVNKQTTSGKTALHFAIRKWNLDLVQQLLEYGADVTMKDINGKNAMHVACECFVPDKNALDLILTIHKKNADLVKEVTDDGDTCLHLALSRCQNETNEGLILWLIEETELDLNVSNELGETALHLAVKKGKLHLVQLLLDHGADVSLKNTDGENVLHVACRYTSDDKKIALVLHEKNGNLAKGITKDGSTCLHLALISSELEYRPLNEELIVWLVEETEVDLNKRNTFGLTAMMLAFKLGNRTIVDLLRTKNVD